MDGRERRRRLWLDGKRLNFVRRGQHDHGDIEPFSMLSVAGKRTIDQSWIASMAKIYGGSKVSSDRNAAPIAQTTSAPSAPHAAVYARRAC